MNKEKQLIIENLINESIKIMITELEESTNGANLKFTHKTNGLVGGLLKGAICKFSLDWSSDIIRDEVYKSFTESIIRLSEDFTIEEMKFNNNEFKAKVFALSNLLIKNNLVSPSRRSRTGERLSFNEELVDPQVNEEKGNSKLEELLNKSILDNNETELQHFLKFFHENKNTILTNKQLAFINNELLDIGRKNASKMRKRIAERIISAYEKEFKTLSDREAEMVDIKNTITSILDAKNFREEFMKNRDNDYIMNNIIDNVSYKSIRAFNEGCNSESIIKEFRIALYHRLNKINNMLDEKGIDIAY